MNKKISIIIVSYNCVDLLIECLESLYKNDCKDFEVIVSDNGSSDGTKEKVKNIFPSVIFLENKTNIGFGAACNRGARNACGDWLFFLNPDTETKKNTIGELISFCYSRDDISAAGAKLLWPDETYQDSYKKFFSPFFSVLELFEFHYYFKNNFLNKKINYGFEVFKIPTEVDFVIGAAMAVKKTSFFEIGGFDEDFFMYFEEIDLCKRISQKGGKVFFIPNCEVIHKKGKVSEKTSVRSLEYYKSMKLYHEKHSFKGAGVLIRFSIFIMCLVFISVISVKMIAPYNIDIKTNKLKLKIKLLKWAIGL
ncbi:MAG: glycosyltransferase family 2 protein [Elusimicrobiota bacterium]